MIKKRVVAVLESMWDWRQATSRAGYKEAPRSFTINPQNHSGKRLYKLVGPDVELLVTNSCRELVASANHHGIPDPDWLRENILLLEYFDALLVCGKIAQATYDRTGLGYDCVLRIPHPAARMWSHALIQQTQDHIDKLLS